MRISDWSSDVCSSDLKVNREFRVSRPNALWVVDFTYVHSWAGFVQGNRVKEGATNARIAESMQILRFGRGDIVRDSGDQSSGALGEARSEESRGAKAGVSTCRSRWAPDPNKKN